MFLYDYIILFNSFVLVDVAEISNNVLNRNVKDCDITTRREMSLHFLYILTRISLWNNPICLVATEQIVYLKYDGCVLVYKCTHYGTIPDYRCTHYQRLTHHNDVIMGAVASQITSLTIVYWTVDSDADQRKHQSSESLAFVREIHRRPVNSPHKWPVTRKMFLFDDVIMYIENWITKKKTFAAERL